MQTVSSPLHLSSVPLLPVLLLRQAPARFPVHLILSCTCMSHSPDIDKWLDLSESTHKLQTSARMEFQYSKIVKEELSGFGLLIKPNESSKLS